MHIARDADRRDGILVHLADLAALQPHLHVLAHHHLGAVVPRLLLLGRDDAVRARAPAELGGAVLLRPDAEDGLAHGDHVHRQAVAPVGRLARQDTRVDDAAHALEQLARDAGAVAVDDVAGPHAVGRDDVRLAARRLAREQRDVRRAARVVLDALDEVRAGRAPVEVDGADAPLGAAAAVPHRDAARVVAPAARLALLGDGERPVRPPAPQVVVDGPLEVADAGRPGLVRAQDEGLVRVARGGRGGLSVLLCVGGGRAAGWGGCDRCVATSREQGGCRWRDL